MFHKTIIWLSNLCPLVPLQGLKNTKRELCCNPPFSQSRALDWHWEWQNLRRTRSLRVFAGDGGDCGFTGVVGEHTLVRWGDFCEYGDWRQTPSRRGDRRRWTQSLCPNIHTIHPREITISVSHSMLKRVCQKSMDGLIFQVDFWSVDPGTPVLISSMKTTMKNILQLTFFLWLRQDVDELKWISDDKNNNEMYAAPSLTRKDRIKMLFEDYRKFKT